MTTKELENYKPKGQLIGFPKEIIAHMLESQKEQVGRRDVTVFENNTNATMYNSGFDWNLSKEGLDFWFNVINKKNFNLFFEKYPKKDNQEENQKFKIGDKVIDIISGQIGKVTKIDTLNNDSYSILVDFNNNEIARFTLDGRYYNSDKYPRLLHYREDYNYDVIDFNNLPKRQRWRAEVGGIYYFIKRDDYDSELDRVCETKDYYSYISNEQYKIGNYFKTREQAQEIVDQTNTYFQKIVKI